jgi:3-oxoacyl-[acyl-carrier-protein] synthase II
MASNWTDRRVVVTGLGVISSLGQQIEPFWDNIVSGRCGIDRITSFDTANFECQIAAEVRDFNPAPAFPSPKELKRTDRFSQFGVYAAYHALLDSGMDLDKLDRDEIGVVIGSGIGGLQTTEDQHTVLLERGPKRISPFLIPMLILNMASGMFSMYHKLRGPNVATCSACATSTHAIGEAWRTIKMGDAKAIFAGGAEATVVPMGIAGFCAMRAMSTRNHEPKRSSRPFDLERDGFVMGEGSGVLALEELEHAKARGAKIYCEIVGYGNTADASHITSPAPEGEGAARCMKMALRSAGLNPTDISRRVTFARPRPSRAFLANTPASSRSAPPRARPATCWGRPARWKWQSAPKPSKPTSSRPPSITSTPTPNATWIMCPTPRGK